jgi:hypothetical protein
MYSGKNPMLPAVLKNVNVILLMNFNFNSLISTAPSSICINIGSHYSDWATGRTTENHYLLRCWGRNVILCIVQKTSGAHPASFTGFKAAGA